MEPERPTARSNPARGVALIATAVILGLFVVRNGFDDPSSADDGSPTTEAAGGTTTPAVGGGGEGSAATTAPGARPPSEVTVIVANASGAAGAAGQLTQNIAGAQYQTLPETNAPEAVTATQVLFVEGFEREAGALAAEIGAPGGGVAAMPDPPPVELAGAQILVLLGPDLAGG